MCGKCLVLKGGVQLTVTMDIEEEKEKRLISDLVSGDEEALSVFYRIYAPRLERFIISRVQLREDADEILQDTLLSALDSLVLFSRRSKFFSWLCGIARHEIADYYRKRKIKTVVFSRFPGVLRFVSRALEPDAKFMRDEYERRVKLALEKLLPHYRQVLELKYMDGLSVVEIAERMGMSFKACESALTRARRAFELAYEEE